MLVAQVANEDSLLLHPVALLVCSGAHIDAVLVVEAAAHGVALDDAVTHCDCGCLDVVERQMISDRDECLCS
jgi:hypothetical protein